MVTTKTVQEVSKSQRIRLVDIFFLGPLMVRVGFKKGNISNLEKSLMVFFGISTIYYNFKNYQANKDLV